MKNFSIVSKLHMKLVFLERETGNCSKYVTNATERWRRRQWLQKFTKKLFHMAYRMQHWALKKFSA